ncbi:MAG: response regulator transcription factor [Bacteroidales bacterium]|nr:response regulator transcription factor [Bacteroidales bacterium]
MIKALLLDDEPLALRQLELYAAKVPYMEVLASCTSARQAIQWVSAADVLFVDINMPDVSGLEFVRSLEQPPLIVFTTAYAEYALEGFRVNALGYLVKPFSLVEFQEQADKVQEIVETRRKAAALQSAPAMLYFKTDYKTVTVNPDEIRYVEGMSEYIKIYLDGREAPLVVLYSLKRLTEQLPADRFMRVHRSYIVPLARIREATPSTIVLEEGFSLPVGDSYRAAFRAWLSLKP